MDERHHTHLQGLIRWAEETRLDLFSDHKKHRNSALMLVLHMARKDAIEALAKLPEVPPTDAEQIRILQNEVWMFRNLVHYVRKIFERGDGALDQLEQSDRESVRAAVADDNQPGDDE